MVAITELAGTLAENGATIVSVDKEDYVREHYRCERDEIEHFPDREALNGGEVTLGFYASSHIGDVLCSSTLPRKLSKTYGCRVFVVRHRSTLGGFAHNPYVTGFRNEGRLGLLDCIRGRGHIIHKLERFFGLPRDVVPRPEIYLSPAEPSEAWRLRGLFPRDRPVVALCANSVTDERVDSFDRMPWQRWVDAMSDAVTVVQLALTSVRAYEEIVALDERARREWRPASLLRRCCVLENASYRQLVAFLSTVDGYIGTNAGPCHVAAAFGKPAIVVLNRKTDVLKLKFPNQGMNQHNLESFLYPNHLFAFVPQDRPA